MNWDAFCKISIQNYNRNQSYVHFSEKCLGLNDNNAKISSVDNWRLKSEKKIIVSRPVSSTLPTSHI